MQTGLQTATTSGQRYAALGPGKRLRPFFALETGKMFDLAERPVLRAACALECIHAYSLVHDDLPAMDDGGCCEEAVGTANISLTVQVTLALDEAPRGMASGVHVTAGLTLAVSSQHLNGDPVIHARAADRFHLQHGRIMFGLQPQ